MKQQKKKKGRSVQDLLGIRTFTKYGLSTNKGELLFYLVSPTNISVLSHTNIEIKIRHLMMVLSALPDIEIVCTDSSECFDDIESKIAGEGFEVHRLKKPEIKRILALYFEASMQGEAMPDIDGEQFYEGTDDEDEE